MSAIALGNLIGASASYETVLLGARMIEGVGFVGVVLAIPSMLARLVLCEARDFVMAVWCAYMPTGIMLMLLAAPLLSLVGCRNFWLANAAVASMYALVPALHAPAMREATRRPTDRFFAQVTTVVWRPGCLVLALTFFAFSCQIFSLAFALPLLLTSVHGASLGAAGLLGAPVMAASAVGHVASGVLLRIGVPIWVNIASAFCCLALSVFVVYGGFLPARGISLVAALALGIGGLAPGAIYAAAPHVAPSPSTIPPTIGHVQQVSSLGQFAGPAVLGLWVESFGWPAAPVILVPTALVGLVSALVLRRHLNISA